MFFRNEHPYNRLVGLVGKLWPSKKEMRQAKSFLHENQNLDATTLVDIAWAQGVAPQVYHNILCLKEQSQHLTFLNQFFLQAQQDLEERKKYIMRLFADLELFHAEVSAIGGRFMVIKGACFQNLYPAESFRQMGDIDLVISQDTVWKGIDAFKRIRHRPKRIRLEKYPYSAQSSDGIFGIAEMLDLDGDPRALPFDLHLGAFPGCGDSILESNMWDRAIPLRVGHREVLVASLEDCILIICSHISRHGYAKLRDLNDTHVVLRHAGNNFDWDYLYQFARKNSLQTILYGLLLRLQRDYEVELPTEVISKLKPDGLDILTSKFLFKPGRENLNFHGGRRLFLGRFLQTAFLYRYYLERAGFLTATKESLSGLYFLFQSGRPYRLWRQRHIQSFSSNRRIVIIPIEATTHKECWQIEQILLPKVQKFAAKSGIAIEWVGNQVIIWNVGHPNELLLTPEGIYAQSPYDGHLCNNTLEKIQRIAWEVVSQLSEVGAILGKLVAL